MAGSNGYIATRAYGGKTVNFRRFTMGDLCQLGALMHERNVGLLGKRLAALYKASGIEEDKLAFVVAELTREPGFSETYRWVYTSEGVRQGAALLTGCTVAEVDGWDDPLGVARIVQQALDAGGEKVVDGSLPLSETSGVQAVT